MWIICQEELLWMGNISLICFWSCVIQLKLSAVANFDVAFSSSKTMLLCILARIPCILRETVVLNFYFKHPALQTPDSQTSTDYKATGPEIWWWRWVNICCVGGVGMGLLQWAWLILLQNGYRITVSAMDQVFWVYVEKQINKLGKVAISQISARNFWCGPVCYKIQQS